MMQIIDHNMMCSSLMFVIERLFSVPFVRNLYSIFSLICFELFIDVMSIDMPNIINSDALAVITT
ncbi:hypothetical protein WV31_05530 [Magnetospirillum sp. ME-1]|nr:hypothetical protein WV31_05530 [Magnetospirillum sp. ME-1]